MNQTVTQIGAHLDRTRRQLDRQVDQLDEKIDALTGWRAQLHARPGTVMGAAFAAGLLLAHLTSRQSEPRRAVTGPQTQEIWDQIRTALISVAAAKITGYLGSLVPDFDEHLQRAERRLASRPSL